MLVARSVAKIRNNEPGAIFGSRLAAFTTPPAEIVGGRGHFELVFSDVIQDFVALGF